MTPGQSAGGNNPVLFALGGIWTSLTVYFQGSYDTTVNAQGVPNFGNPFAMWARQSLDLSVVSSLLSTPIAVPDNPSGLAGYGYYVQPDGGMSIRMVVASLGSGSPVVTGRTVDFFPSLPANSPAAFNQNQSLVELVRIRTTLESMAVGQDATSEVKNLADAVARIGQI